MDVINEPKAGVSLPAKVILVSLGDKEMGFLRRDGGQARREVPLNSFT